MDTVKIHYLISVDKQSTSVVRIKVEIVGPSGFNEEISLELEIEVLFLGSGSQRKVGYPTCKFRFVPVGNLVEIRPSTGAMTIPKSSNGSSTCHGVAGGRE